MTDAPADAGGSAEDPAAVKQVAPPIPFGVRADTGVWSRLRTDGQIP